MQHSSGVRYFFARLVGGPLVLVEQYCCGIGDRMIAGRVAAGVLGIMLVAAASPLMGEA